MDTKTVDFIHDAEKAVPPEYRKYAEQAAVWIAEYIGPQKWNLSLVSSLAAKMSDVGAANKPADKSGPLPLTDTPQEAVMSQMFADWARPWAERIRAELFHSSDVPFPQEGEAIKWIEHEATRKKLSKKWRDRVSNLVRRFADEADRMATKGMPPVLRLDVGVLDVLPYPGEDNGKRRTLSVPASFNPVLYRLAKETEEMADRTGWQQVQTVMFVLTGAVPPTPRVRSRMHESITQAAHGPLRRHWLELQIVGGDFSRREWMTIYENLRQMGAVKKKSLRAKNAEVFSFVRENRPKLTWKQTLEKWNKAYPKERYRTIRGLQKAYDRALKKGMLDAPFGN